MADPGISVSHTLDPPVLTVARTFAAPRELVFRAWTECERLTRWFGPKGWELTFCELDLRPDGVWRYCMSGPNGMESWGRAVYREVVPHERIVYTDAFSNAAGEVDPAMPQTVVTVLLEGSTEVTARTEFASGDELNAVLAMGVVKGTSETWDRLAALLAEG